MSADFSLDDDMNPSVQHMHTANWSITRRAAIVGKPGVYYWEVDIYATDDFPKWSYFVGPCTYDEIWYNLPPKGLPPHFGVGHPIQSNTWGGKPS